LNETFSDETFSDETFSDETFSDETFSDETFSDETFSNETFSNEIFSNIILLPAGTEAQVKPHSRISPSPQNVYIHYLMVIFKKAYVFLRQKTTRYSIFFEPRP